MALFNPTFILGVLVLLYLLSFVLFAVVRIVTGLSIQRIGYFSLRRLAYVPRDGLKIEIRGLGLNIHRPTFSQPTWLSIVVSELVVTIDSSELEGNKLVEDKGDAGDASSSSAAAAAASATMPDGQDGVPSGSADDAGRAQAGLPRPPQPPLPSKHRETAEEARSKTWRQLMKLKERIKRLHRNVNWLRLVDVVATDSAVNVVGVGNVQFGNFTVAVDTRRKMVNRDRLLFQGSREAPPGTRQAEWIMTLRSVLFTADGRESMEVVDNATLNVHGFLYEALDGLRDAAIALKLGRVHLPYDDLVYCAERYRQSKLRSPEPTAVSSVSALKEVDPSLPNSPILEEPPSSLQDAAREAARLGSADDGANDGADGTDNTEDNANLHLANEDDLARTVSDSKEFVSSILRGIKEVQFAVSFLGIAKKVQTIKAAGAPVLLMNVSMKEVGVDLHRLDPRSPAHRMYFSPKDIAHEALAAALSIAVGVDDGHGSPQRLMYIPMVTTTVKTTLPSKTIEITEDVSAEARNANILFANSVVTSPSVDLDPRHLPLLLAMLNQPKKPPSPPATVPPTKRRDILISRLLPKASIKFSVHEPVIRIALPPVSPTADPDDFDLIISSISSISLDMESFHFAVEKLHYSLASTARLRSHNLYYQTSAGDRFDLLQTESLDLKAQLNASPDVRVVASGNLQTFSVKMVRPEIIDGLSQIVKQLRPSVEPDKKRIQRAGPRQGVNFLRAMPAWLLHFHMQASDFSMEVAGVDKAISDDAKGVAVQLETWTVEYRAQRLDGVQRRPGRRRTVSRAVLMPDTDLLASASSAPRRKHHHNGDGRRIAIHCRGLEAFVVQSLEKWEVDPFVNVPRFEIAFSTLSDNQGPIFHIHAHVRTLLLHYALHRHYSVGVAATVLQQAFVHAEPGISKKPGAAETTAPTATQSIGADSRAPLSELLPTSPSSSARQIKPAVFVSSELVAVDVKVAFIQIKGDMPSDPPLMLQIHNLETGRHRWSPPFFYWKLIRLHAEAPRMPKVWARVLSIKNGRLDCKETTRKLPTSGFETQRTFDIATDVIRFAVPHELILYKIADNIINVFKSVLQLHHRFKTRTEEYILGKAPEGPKKVPRVSLRCRTFAFELEDGAFEWKLGMIYRAGRVEQMQRLAREEAFRVKVKKIQEEEARRETSKFRARSAAPTPRGRGANAASSSSTTRRSLSEDRLPGSRSTADAHGLGRRPRYDPEGSSLGMTGSAHISIAEARHRLNLHNSRGWKRRIDRYYLMARNGMREIRGLFWGPQSPADGVTENERVLEVPDRPALMTTLIDDLHFVIDKPSFPLKELPDFLHKVGKGMPRDKLYTLLVPMNVQIRMGEAKVTLRDYPLPLLHVPGITSNQPSNLHALSLSTDFVIAEEFQGPESVRHVKIDVLPPTDKGPGASKAGSFAIDVRRTTSQVKTYSDMAVDINTALPTKITWGTSYQPAIQDMMMVFESFTKPQLDPSENVGFWDKIRLSFHSRVRVAWKADGNVHLALKGTRDPYQVTGNGAGFLMCWRNDVRWNIHVDDDPKQFMTVDSGEYILAIPDYSHHAREVARQTLDDDSVISEDTLRSGAAFKKVVMKLSGRVQWLAGLVFERAIENGKRNFDFTPHYNVVLKAPQYAHSTNGLPYDAFRGFRSQHIHMSIAVRAPVDREWTVSNSEPSRSYNTVHLSPRFFTHFFAWWSLFSGPMSLPIRQGKLWPGCEKNSKKFGRHLATIKYNLLLAPLFLSHMYKHKDSEEHPDKACISATGIKVRFDSFMLDLHQRREEFNTRDKGRKTQSRTSGMKIHACQLDLASADIRAVSATIHASTVESIQDTMAALVNNEEESADISHFTIPDDDFSWIDMDDFVELDWILPTEPNPDTKILPLAFAPRITYFRQTDIGGVISGDPDRTSPFGHEPTHLCIMTPDDDPRTVQMQLIRNRLRQLDEQIDGHVRDIRNLAARINDDFGHQNPLKAAEIETLSRQANVLQEKKLFLENSFRQLGEEATAAATAKTAAKAAAAARDSQRKGQDTAGSRASDNEGTENATSMGGLPLPPVSSPADPDAPDSGAEFASEFTNRFVVHNMKLKWNNMLRNIILRYIHQVSQRRGFVYYLSRPAVKFILDIVEEQIKLKAAAATPASSDAPSAAAASKAGSGFGVSQSADALNKLDRSSTKDIEDRIRKILQDGRKFVSAEDVHNDETKKEGTAYSTPMEDLSSGIAAEFTPQNSYHVHLIAPQIQLQSDKNLKHVVLVTAKGMELKVVEVMDKARLSDNVSGLVQRRFLVGMDSTQFFVTHRKWFSTRVLSTYSGSSYGSPKGSSWPPWVPLEAMFDFHTDPFGFKRVVQKTSAMLRYDKYNTLRLKYTDGVNTGEGASAASHDSPESRMDNLWIEFPQARALCNSSQYYAIYVIVLDLLMYSEPLEKTRSERLEKIMLASDFSDLRGAPEMVTRLQERVRQLEDIKTHFQIHSKNLDKRGWEERLLLERDLAACEDELFFIMKAITTSQGKTDATQSNALLKWSISAREIVWHLIRDNNEPLVELQLNDVEYGRTDIADGSHINLIQVGRILGLNLLPDAIYPEMIAPYIDERGPLDAGAEPMVRVYWYMLEAIAGITVMDHVEVTLFPMKIQLEHEVGKKLFEYIFPETHVEQASGTTAASAASSSVDGNRNGKGNGNGNGNGNANANAFDSPFSMKQMAPSGDEDSGGDEEFAFSIQGGRARLESAASEGDRDAASASATSFDGRAGSLELRLHPTLTSNQRTSTEKQKMLSVHATEAHSFRFFRPPTAHGNKGLVKKPSHDSLQSGGPLRIGVGRSSTGFSSIVSESKKSSRFTLRSKPSDDKQNSRPSDDLTKMITRASNYKTFAYIRLPSVVLCLSYKGKGERNLEDVHDFVFRLPTIEYRNKTWSNLDLALALKSRVIKALISHTGAIIGNKLSKHRPNTAQQSKLRELVTNSVLLSTPALPESRDNSGDDSSSLFGTSPVDFSRSPPRSLHGSQMSIPLARSNSRGSSVASSSRSFQSNKLSVNTTAGPVPEFLMMTPPTPQQDVAGSQSTSYASSNRSVADHLRPASRSSGRSLFGVGGGNDALSEKKKSSSAFGGVRDRLNAFASKVKDRDSSASSLPSGPQPPAAKLRARSLHSSSGDYTSSGSGGGGGGGGSGGSGFVDEKYNDGDATPVRRQGSRMAAVATSLDGDHDDRQDHNNNNKSNSNSNSNNHDHEDHDEGTDETGAGVPQTPA